MASAWQSTRKRQGLWLGGFLVMLFVLGQAFFFFIDAHQPTWADFVRYFPAIFLQTLGISAAIVAGLVALGWLLKPLEKRLNPSFAIEESPHQIDIDDLRRNPQQLRDLHGAFDRICVIRTLQADGDGGGESVYTSFAVTHGGEICTIEEDLHDAYILGRAQWLADALQLPLKDTSYGLG